MKNKRIIAFVLALLLVIPAYAVLSEKDLAQTLSVLRYELGSTFRQSQKRPKRMPRKMKDKGEMQHTSLVGMMQRSNDASRL